VEAQKLPDAEEVEEAAKGGPRQYKLNLSHVKPAAELFHVTDMPVKPVMAAVSLSPDGRGAVGMHWQGCGAFGLRGCGAALAGLQDCGQP